jgi:hypothetical protein
VENFVHQPQNRPIRTDLPFALKPFGKERDKLVAHAQFCIYEQNGYGGVQVAKPSQKRLDGLVFHPAGR